MSFIQFLWLSIPVLCGPMFRSHRARLQFPGLTKWFYIYLWVHGGLLFLAAIMMRRYLTGEEAYLAWLVFPFVVISSITALYFAAFESFDPEEPDAVPIGVVLYTKLRPHKFDVDQDGLVHPEPVEPPRPMTHAEARRKAYEEKQKALRLQQEKMLSEARAATTDAAMEYNRRKLEEENLKRQFKSGFGDDS